MIRIDATDDMIEHSTNHAERYDELWQFFHLGRVQQIRSVIEKTKIKPGSLILDIGCGTGTYTMPLAVLAQSKAIAVDSSIRMLRQMQGKLVPSCDLALLQADGEQLPLRSNSVDLVFMSYVLHQVRDRRHILSEALRVLREGKNIAILTSSHKQLRLDMVHRYFPGVLSLNLGRFPSLPELRSLLGASGFRRIGLSQLSTVERTSLQALREKVEGKYLSALALLPEEQFQEGLRIFDSKLEQHFANGELIYTHSTSLITATKPRGI